MFVSCLLFPKIPRVQVLSIRQTDFAHEYGPLHATMLMQPPEQRPMIERVERAMVLLAYLIELDGEEHVPMFEKFETELKELRQTEDVKVRARRLLELHNRSRTSKAIAPNNAITNIQEYLLPMAEGSPIG